MSIYRDCRILMRQMKLNCYCAGTFQNCDLYVPCDVPFRYHAPKYHANSVYAQVYMSHPKATGMKRMLLDAANAIKAAVGFTVAKQGDRRTKHTQL